jgi:PilZ domain
VPTTNELEPERAEKQYPEKRRSRRAKIAKTLRVRPSEPKDEPFEDLPVSINVSKEGILFKTRQATYYPGMRVFVTFPYSSPHDPMNCEYVAQVVRVDKLPNGRFGIAVDLLMTVNYSPGKPGSSGRP